MIAMLESLAIFISQKRQRGIVICCVNFFSHLYPFFHWNACVIPWIINTEYTASNVLYTDILYHFVEWDMENRQKLNEKRRIKKEEKKRIFCSCLSAQKFQYQPQNTNDSTWMW